MVTVVVGAKVDFGVDMVDTVVVDFAVGCSMVAALSLTAASMLVVELTVVVGRLRAGVVEPIAMEQLAVGAMVAEN